MGKVVLDSHNEQRDKKVKKHKNETQSIKQEISRSRSRDGRMKKSKKSKKRHRSSSSSSSSSDIPKKKSKKMKRKKHKAKTKRRDESTDSSDVSHHTPLKFQKSTSLKKEKKKKEVQLESPLEKTEGPDPRSLAMRPMTQEEWEARQSVVRRVYDEETGRSRLVKGDGEILEEIVSRQRHQEINKMATKGDGNAFQIQLGLQQK